MRMNLTRVAAIFAIASMGVIGCKVSLKAGTPDTPPPPPPTPKPMPKPKPKPRPKFGKFKFKVKDNRVELPGPVMFEVGNATLKPESDAVLEIVQAYLEQHSRVTKHRIEGHTDTDGTPVSNQKLSELRAMSVARWLVAKGIDCKRLLPTGFGQNSLKIDPEKTAEDKQANRRVEFINAELDNKAIASRPVDGGGKIAGDPCK